MCPALTPNAKSNSTRGGGISIVFSLSNFLVLHDTDLGSAQDPAVELEALLLHKENGVILLVILLEHGHGLVLIGVELLAHGIESLQTVLLEGAHENALRHPETLVQLGQVLELLRLVLSIKLLLGNHGQCAVEVVNAVDQIFGEARDRKLAGVLDLALSAVLEVTEVGNGAETFVLDMLSVLGSMCHEGAQTNPPVRSLLIFGF